MVQTRSTARLEREQNGGVQKRGVDSQLQHDNRLSAAFGVGKSASIDVPMVKNDVIMPANSVKSEPPPPAPASAKSGKSSLASAQARKKRLEMQAAIKKAKIRMELIDKQLEVDIAELEEEEIYSPHKEKGNEYVEKWLESSYKEIDKASIGKQRAAAATAPFPPATQLATTPPPAPLMAPPAPPPNTDATLHMLASTIRDLATAACSNSNNNGNLLSRLSTPRELPEFSGDPIEWLQFKQSYDESTEVCRFSAKENLWRLRKCLRGAAKDTVSAMLISATSPDMIISTLQLRFGSPDGIINRIIQDIKRLPQVSHDYHKDIVMFSCKVRNFIEAVRALNTEEYLQGMSIVSIILSKLPTVLLSKWADYSFPIITESNKKSRLIILSDFLHNEALKVSTITSSVNISGVNYRTDNRYHNNHKSQTVLLQSESSPSDDKCEFCNSDHQHKLTDCKQFKKALRKTRWQYVKRKRLCYKCLLCRHTRDTCPAAACDKDGCGAPHHRLLHFNNNNSRMRNDVKASDQQPSVQSVETVTHINASECQVLLKVVPVRIHGPNGIISASALLDDGSTVSLISSDLAERAGLRGRRERMRVSGAWNNNELVCDVVVTGLRLSGMDNKIYSIRARSVNELNLPLQTISTVKLSSTKLCNIKKQLLSLDNKPEILIGQDNYDLMLPMEIVSGNNNEPYATLTPLGWCIHGSARMPRSGSGPATSGHVNLCVSAQGSAMMEDELMLRDLNEQVKQSFTIDSLGISSAVRQNVDEVRALDYLEKTSELIDGRWFVSLPWKDPNCKLPDSYSNAYKRLLSIEKKMSMCEGFAQRYKERIEHLLSNDFAQEPTVVDQVSQKIWYLPHFGVDNPNKKKLRLVFDAASKANSLCLNDYLLSGPDLLSSLFGIMLRFREHSIAVTGDIKDMFLRIKIHPADQHALRFLWRDSPTEPVKTYVMTSLIFGANCSPFIAQFIKNKNAERYRSSLPAAVDAVRNSHYMDDYIDSFEDENSAIEMVNNIIKIHKEGGFEIRNFTSNSLNVLQTLPKESVGEVAVRFKIDQQYDGERTLGLIWFTKEDKLGFDVTLKRVPEAVVEGKQRPTKRLMLRVIMSIFDVFGFLSPFVIQGRSMLQETWRLNIGWDDYIPDEVFSRWCNWLDLLKVIKDIRISRCYLPAASATESDNHDHTAASFPRRAVTTNGISASTEGATTPSRYNAVALATTTSASKNRYEYLELHMFSDAAAKAMCTVAYWRWDDNGETRVVFVASKCRVMPVKPLTIPRAELQAALLAARLAHTIINEHKLKPIRRYFWCDSTTVLHWIRNNTRSYKTFEANRLGEIDELTRTEEWRYVPSYLNVADLATRDEFSLNIFQGEWLNGPEFLYNDRDHWPLDVIQPDVNEINSATCMVLKQSAPDVELPVPDPGRFSSWLKLLRATATVLKFIDACRGLTREIDCDKMVKAERLLMRHAQLQSFSEEIASIKMGNSIPRTSRLLTSTPVLDEEGLLRVGGRIDAALDVDLGMKRPIILDGRHPIARLIARYYHVKAAHGNQETVVNELRQKYWIIRLRPTVKTVVSQCMLCRIRKCKPQVPRMGDLPHARLAHHQRPFTFCGLDLFGPVEVAVGRRKEKRYCVLFTCLTVRAIHIEVVSSLSTDSLIMALRRMAARRGWPRHLYSDNGTNLRGAEKELRQNMALNEEILKQEGVNNQMDWHFIPPGSPHWGGAWERQIRTVKTSLKVITTERTPKEETLITFLAEVENIVNSRPLSHVAVDPSTVESLTPNHFLLGSSSNSPIIGEFDDSDMYLRKQWRKAQRLADMFWTRWVKEILPDMLPRKKWNDERVPLQVGNLVLIVDPSSPRNTWPRGVVHQVYPGKDGRIRMVDVKTKSGIWRRSAARVAPISLEV